MFVNSTKQPSQRSLKVRVKNIRNEVCLGHISKDELNMCDICKGYGTPKLQDSQIHIKGLRLTLGRGHWRFSPPEVHVPFHSAGMLTDQANS
jgi:hypothetical protein